MNWSKSIILTFVLFAGFIGTLVYRMCRQQIDLVRDDYYQDEITYQQHIDRVGNAARLTNPWTMTYLEEQQQVVFILPDSLRKGEIKFYRPADRQQDRSVKIPEMHPIRQVVSTETIGRGYWRVKLTWTDGRREYYTENELFL